MLDFARDYPDIIAREVDHDTGETICRVNKLPVTPYSFSLILGDALHNLRSALDYLVYELVKIAGNLPDSKTAFPVFDSQELYEKHKSGRIKGLTPKAIEAIDRIEPGRAGRATNSDSCTNSTILISIASC